MGVNAVKHWSRQEAGPWTSSEKSPWPALAPAPSEPRRAPSWQPGSWEGAASRSRSYLTSGSLRLEGEARGGRPGGPAKSRAGDTAIIIRLARGAAGALAPFVATAAHQRPVACPSGGSLGFGLLRTLVVKVFVNLKGGGVFVL